MVYVEPRDGEPAAAHREVDGEYGGQPVLRHPQDEQKQSHAHEAATVEDLPHVGCAKDLIPA